MSNLTTLGTLGPYRLLSLLGVGGMAEVYRAYDPRLDREVAIKLLPIDLAKRPGFLERFRHEARIVARLDHPNIMPIYDSGEEEGVMYVVMPLMEGGTVRDRIAQRGVCSLREATSIVYQVALALHEAHQHGLVHRDVKPANILLAPGERAVLADFGIARALADGSESSVDEPGIGIGTAEYMSPEQAQGEPVDHRADVYALGIVLFHMLTGRVPFSTTDRFSTIYQQIHEPPPRPRSLNPMIPPEVEDIILTALAKAPAKRFQSAAQFAEALAEAVPALHLSGMLALAPKQQTPVSGMAVVTPQRNKHASEAMSASSWNAWQGPIDGESLTVPGAPWQPAEGMGAIEYGDPRAIVYGSPRPRSRSGKRWMALVALVLAISTVAGAVAVGRMRAQQFALSSSFSAPQAPAPTQQPTATATPAVTAYYKAQFFELVQGDLMQGDLLGDQISIDNDHYQAFEGAHGTIFQSGAADHYGRAFGTGTVVHNAGGTFRFVILVDRFATIAQAIKYYQYSAGLLSVTTSVSVGQQAIAGLAHIHGNRANFRLVMQDQNIVVTFATASIEMPLAFQPYFTQLAQIIDQRGHRCLYNAALNPLPGSPAMCNGTQ